MPNKRLYELKCPRNIRLARRIGIVEECRSSKNENGRVDGHCKAEQAENSVDLSSALFHLISTSRFCAARLTSFEYRRKNVPWRA